MMTGGEAMVDTEKTPAMLLDELATLDPAQRREVAKELRKVAETWPKCPTDGRHRTYWACLPTCSTRQDPGDLNRKRFDFRANSLRGAGCSAS
jgi:hypothetical protein